MVAMVPSSFTVTVTSTGPPKPWAVAVKLSSSPASSAASAGNRLFSASSTAVLVTVAPVMASTPFSP